VKDALNGVSLNLEVTRSRTRTGEGVDSASLTAFAEAAADQLELVSARVEALLFLARPARGDVDVAAALRFLATLLVPAAKSDNIPLQVDASDRSVPTTASAVATRLALAGGLLALIKEGGGRCALEPGKGGETVVRFSHESAGTCSLGDDIASAIAAGAIRTDRSGTDLLIIFPR
jgi:hypothetical protein